MAVANVAPRRSPNPASLFVRQLSYEQRVFWRNPASAFFTFFLPLIFLFIFVSVFGNQKITYNHSGLQGVRGAQYYVPSILVYGIVAACFSNLAVMMAFRRELGLLKRERGTPLPAWLYLVGSIGNSVLVSVVMALITLGVGAAFYHVQWPVDPGAFALAIVVGAACFCALGLATVTILPNADAGPAIVNVVMLVLLFMSGIFFVVNPSSGLAHVASVFPVVHLFRAVFAAIVPQPHTATWAWSHLLVLGLWGVAGLLVAARRFRWTPGKA